ncbi:hypothetical protein [Candidatus Halocynthiibacter alkanivorans]|uniref:hypothetical protein n=1 Tax=Candidatus Halocynthiibacter alkanivorans TaxID=2267619 RepID=UPI000DF4ABC9|nr:hypothetical protein [Candidatus Halocynthiibacter alkanivorans]
MSATHHAVTRLVRQILTRNNAGIYEACLMRQGRICYLCKRLPQKLSNHQSNKFRCLSLRTDLPPDAGTRAARLLSVCRRVETEIMHALNNSTLGPSDIKALRTEVLRGELAKILAEQTTMGSLSDGTAEARITEVEGENRALRRVPLRQN